LQEGNVDLLKPQTTFHGRYEIERCLKSGGMGAVYEVTDRGTRRRRALKTMLPALVADPDMRARFHLEATVAADIESEHIVEVFDAGVDEATGLPFLVMELLKGRTLGDALQRRGQIASNDVIAVFHQAALALDRTHAAGIVHRDLKPDNLFLTRRDDGSLRLKVLDFGIAKVVAHSTQAHTTRSFGTPLYMSPEQIRGDGDIGARSDLYSLGHIAFALLVGRPYWEPESQRATGVYGLLVKIMEGAPEPASVRAERLGARLPKRFDEWFARATALDPAGRFDTASELVEALAVALDVPMPRSARRGQGDTFGVVNTSALLGSVVPVAPSKKPEGDSTGALSSSGNFSRRAKRREKLVWATLVFATATGGALLVARHFVSSPEPSSSSSPPLDRAPKPAVPSAPEPPKAADSTAPEAPPVTSAVTPAPTTAPTPTATEIKKNAPKRPERPARPSAPPPSKPKSPAASAPTTAVTHDPSDIRR
jgi:serine/threonine-protein kinase